jgi:hypothetical protein
VSEQPGEMTSNGSPATLGSAVAEAIVRIRRLWPKIDTAPVIAEYRRVLTDLRDHRIVDDTVTQVIDNWTQGANPPPPGEFATRGATLINRNDWRNHTSSDKGLRWVQAEPDHRDPPGTIRWIVIQPNGQRVPAGARSADDIGAGR